MQHITKKSNKITQQNHPLNHQKKLKNLTNNYPFIINQPLFQHNISKLFNLTNILFKYFQNLNPPKHYTNFNILLFHNISIKNIINITYNFNKSKLSFFSNITLQNQSIISIKYNSFNTIQIYTLIIFIFKFITNNITSLIIIKSPKLHKPFYINILFITLSNLFYILQLLIKYNLHIILKFYQFQSIYKLLKIIKYSTKLNTSLNIIILSTIHFIIFIYPLKNKIFLTNQKIYLTTKINLTLNITYKFLIISFI